MVSARSPISNPSSPLSKAIIMSISVTLMLHIFLNYISSSMYLSLFALSLIFILCSAGMAKSIYVSFYILLLHFIIIIIIIIIIYIIIINICIKYHHLHHHHHFQVTLTIRSSLTLSRPPQVSKTLWSILTDPNTAVVRRVSIITLILNSCISF